MPPNHAPSAANSHTATHPYSLAAVALLLQRMSPTRCGRRTQALPHTNSEHRLLAALGGAASRTCVPAHTCVGRHGSGGQALPRFAQRSHWFACTWLWWGGWLLCAGPGPLSIDSRQAQQLHDLPVVRALSLRDALLTLCALKGPAH